MKLQLLWTQIKNITTENYPSNNLAPILGAGAMNPKYMIVFINPTARNLSSNPRWKGPHYPFIGTNQPWGFFNKLGIIDDRLYKEIRKNYKNWDAKFADKVLNELKKKKVWLTNIVKNTGSNADLPKAKDIKLYLPYFLKEIEIVNPEYIIAFGLIPIKALLKKDVKLSHYRDYLRKNKTLKIEKIKINNKEFKVIPCYYPIGRGNPDKALEILSRLFLNPDP
ncbi:hypothetical protein KY328_04735 [Candidatus Woesearchaeota archaeon]|nr:hypothetical protein [Candidatus Woesearchaeota archaeon]MBW3022204.1 hypothetical protein [Candidatus Woesearchaeota archaeon]